jgi:N-methylhydantoinase B/oxoprolinase/acetone carboxylase alpha subunit
LKPGGSVTFFTAGGGGYGTASERGDELVERDRRLGYVINPPCSPFFKGGNLSYGSVFPSLKKSG